MLLDREDGLFNIDLDLDLDIGPDGD